MASVIACTAARVALVIGASLQRERALAGGGDEARGVEHRGDLGLAAEALQAGAGEHERVEAALAELAQARVDVAAHRHHLQVLARGPQLRGAAHAAGAHARPGGQLLQAGGAAQHVLGRRARRRAEQRQTLGQLAGDVLGGVHREVDLPAANARSSSFTQRDLSPPAAPCGRRRLRS